MLTERFLSWRSLSEWALPSYTFLIYHLGAVQENLHWMCSRPCFFPLVHVWDRVPVLFKVYLFSFSWVTDSGYAANSKKMQNRFQQRSLNGCNPCYVRFKCQNTIPSTGTKHDLCHSLLCQGQQRSQGISLQQ